MSSICCLPNEKEIYIPGGGAFLTAVHSGGGWIYKLIIYRMMQVWVWVALGVAAGVLLLSVLGCCLCCSCCCLSSLCRLNKRSDWSMAV